MLFLPSLNEMFDITSTRAAAMEDYPPLVIFASKCPEQIS